MGQFDPTKRSDEEWQKDVDSGKIDAFKRADDGGVTTYQTSRNGDTVIKDRRPADNEKLHHQTDFVVRDGYIVSVSPHKD